MEVKRVGILRGGENNYEASLREGGEIIFQIVSHLFEKWKPIDIFIDRSGIGHVGGVPVSISELSQKADVFWDTTRMDIYLKLKDSPVVNVSGGISSFSEKSRKMLSEHMKNLGINIPRHILLPSYQKDFDGPLETYATKKAKEVFEKFSPPWKFRLFPGTKKKEIRLIKNFSELAIAIIEAGKRGKSILVEEFVNGSRGTAHSVRGFRGKDIYVFSSLPDRRARDKEMSENFKNIKEKEQLTKLVKSLHEYIPLSYYINAGFVLNQKRGAFLEDLEFSPDFEENSHFIESCNAIGVKPHDVIEHILNQY